MKTPSNKDLRLFIGERFNDSELDTFCFDYFLEVKNDFTTGMRKTDKVMDLIAYCSRRDKMKNLIISLQQERGELYQQTFAPEQPPKQAAQPLVYTPKPRNPKKVFVSHSSKDAELAQQIATDLQKGGYEIFITPNSIQPGEKWVSAIGRGMDESGIFLVLLTNNALDSNWVKHETNTAIASAHENEMRVFMLDVQDCRPPTMWRQWQTLSFRSEGKNYKQNMVDLIYAFEGKPSPQQQVTPPPEHSPAPDPELKKVNAPAALAPLGEGSRLGRYEIVSQLADGGECIVYLGHNARQKTKPVAIKVLRDEFIDDKERVDRFVREADMMDAVSHHPNIIQMRGLEEDGKRLFFAMHYAADGSLQERLQKGALSLTDSMPIIKRIAAALDFIHQKGIVHRELIPKSILFDGNNAFLSDFSNARPPDFTETNLPETTPQFMSPEQIEKDDALDYRTDIYSLGIILYVMLAGRFPFDGKTERAIYGAHLYQPVPNILEYAPQLPVGVADVVCRALAKSADERYDSASAFHAALETAVQSPAPVVTKPRSQKPVVKAVPPPEPDQFTHEKTGMEFVRVSAGDFLYGDNKEKRTLPEYWMCKTAVTNAAYKRFVTDWEYEAGKENHPVVRVSWHDAVAFCEKAGLELPTEEQWEKAARGTKGLTYPWGNNDPTDKLCSFDGKVGDTTPVGNYSPQGDSPYSCVDMSGNVWEWCLNKYSKPEDISIDKSAAGRVLRGGSWSFPQSIACAAARNGNFPANRNPSNGFRVVCVRPPSY